MNLHVKDRKLIISMYLTLFFNQESNLKVKRKKRIKHLPQADKTKYREFKFMRIKEMIANLNKKL